MLSLGGRVLSLTPLRETLEQSFVRLATSDGQAAAHSRQASSA